MDYPTKQKKDGTLRVLLPRDRMEVCKICSDFYEHQTIIQQWNKSRHCLKSRKHLIAIRKVSPLERIVPLEH
jgi:hypothetical protein